jgi:predicted DNA-binding transcriptional regulator AlpA
MRKQLVPRPSNDPAVVFEAHELGHFMFDAAALLEELPMSKQKKLDGPDPPDSKRRRMMTIGDLEEEVGLHRNTIGRYMKQGKFPQPVRPNSRVRRWHRNEVMAWLDANTPRGPRSRPWNRKG